MYQKIIIVISLLLLLQRSANSQELNLNSPKTITIESLTSYNKWRNQHKKNYLNNYEQIFRQSVFLENLRKIKEHNANPKNTYTIGLNEFSDMTQEEFVQKILNNQLSEYDVSNKSQVQQSPNVSSAPASPNVSADPPINPFELLGYFFQQAAAAQKASAEAASKGQILYDKKYPIDWRMYNTITSVKKQGSCGACWAFSVNALMESFIKRKTGQTHDLSEQQLVDCCNFRNGGYSSKGCIGGFPEDALSYASNVGILEESQYPYKTEDGTCKVSGSTTGYKPISFERKVSQTSDDLKVLLKTSPVVALVDSRNFGSYSSGLYNGCDSQIKLNHAVQIIGYDAVGNWIIKNSFGTEWGENGFMTLAGGNTCGILSSIYVLNA